MKRKILMIFCIILLICSVFIPISEASDYLYLNDLEFYVQINWDGSMNVTEIWNIDIEDTNTLFKTFETDRDKYSGITDVKVTDITNGINTPFTQINTYMYHVTKNCYYGLINDDGDFEIAWGVGLDDDSEVRKYKIEYKVNAAITKYNDYAELYWQFIGKDFEISANKVKGTIYLPASANSKENIKVWAHSKDLNGTIYVTDLNKVEFKMDQYRRGRYVEVRVLFPTSQIYLNNRSYNTNILEKAIREETAWAEEANRQRVFNQNLIKFFVVIIILLSAIATIYFIKKISKYKKILKKLKGLKSTQELEYYRDLPDKNATPGEAVFLLRKSYLDFNAYFSEIFSATLLNLSLKKYIDLQVDTTKKDKEAIKIVNLNKEMLDLKDDEKEILKFVLKAIGTKEEITMKELEKYITKHSATVITLIEKTHKNVKNSMKQNNYFDENEYNKYRKYSDYMVLYILGAVITLLTLPLSIVFIINAVYCGKIKKRINILTQIGLDQKEMWQGFEKYMEDFSLLNEREVPELVLWEQYLVYATAFGISEKVLKQLKMVYPNIDEVSGINNSSYMYFMYHSNFNTNFSNAISSSISTATYSSGSGSGGGFSGGGGFGGGGRRRRRKITFFFFKKY